MSTFAVGDIHGNLPALEGLLGQLRRACAGDDTVVFLGDYIDRGPDSRGCVDAILRFRREVDVDVVCLLGNHEDWLLRTMCDYRRHSWLLAMEAFDTIASYSLDAAQALRAAAASAEQPLFLGRRALPYDLFFDRVPSEHIRFFEELRVYHHNADGLFTHGGLNPRVDRLDEQTRDELVWGAEGFPMEYHGSTVVAYGHWNNAVLNADGWPEPRIVGRTIGIDTISHGVLTSVRLPDQQVFQSARFAF